MTWFFWWVRTWFCKHEWSIDERVSGEWNLLYGDIGKPRFITTNVKVSATCKKCAWHRSYQKYC